MRNQKFYMGQIVNAENGSTMMLVSITKEVMNSEKRIAMTQALSKLGEAFTQETGIELRYADIP